MKKILLSLAALFMMAPMAWAGDGSEANPYSVAEVITKYKNNNDINEKGVWIQGYIVGTMNGSYTSLSDITFSAANASPSNMVLAASSTETDGNFCVAIQLVSNTTPRTALNLKDNPQNLGYQVMLQGDITKYCGGAGLKNTSAYQWVNGAPSTGGGNTGTGYLSSNIDGFTIENALTLPAEVPFVWEWSTDYNCAKATGYISGQSYPTDSYLVSPEIELGTNTTATIEQALNYLRDMNLDDNIGIYVREGANGAWNKVSYNNPPAGNSFNFVTSEIDLSAYAGKTIQIGFRYQSTSEGGTTWEIKNLVIGGTAETPDTPTGDNVTFNFGDPTLYGFSPAEGDTEILLAGKTFTTGDVSISFAQQEGASTGIRLFKSSAGTWSFRFYKDTSFTISVPEGYHLTGVVFNGSTLDKDWSYSSGTFATNTWTPNTDTNSVTIAKTAASNNPIIDSITVYYAEGAGEGPDTPPVNPPAQDLEDVTYNFGDPTVYGFTPSDDQTEIPLAGETFTSGIVNLSFAQQEDAKTAIRLFKSNQGWSFRFYNATSFTVSVPEGYNLAKMEFKGNNLGTDWSYSNGSFSGTTWTASGAINSVTIGKTENGNNPIIDSITVYYSAAAGVETIAGEEGEAVYYNLQGVRVANPERGIFVKVQGGKASKVVVR